jgi:hypothetical protein
MMRVGRVLFENWLHRYLARSVFLGANHIGLLGGDL